MDRETWEQLREARKPDGKDVDFEVQAHPSGNEGAFTCCVVTGDPRRPARNVSSAPGGRRNCAGEIEVVCVRVTAAGTARQGCTRDGSVLHEPTAGG